MKSVVVTSEGAQWGDDWIKACWLNAIRRALVALVALVALMKHSPAHSCHTSALLASIRQCCEIKLLGYYIDRTTLVTSSSLSV